MSSEKFCLKWNDFQQNVSKTFSQLRQQSGLFDVTLVSSDQKQVSAHRLVLSACSEFFKNIFYNNTHSHPLLYLDSADSDEIHHMLDYIYQGEVQILKDDVDKFLEVAKKFKLDGLFVSNDEVMDIHTDVNMERKNQTSINEQQNNVSEKHETTQNMIVKEKSREVEAIEANTPPALPNPSYRPPAPTLRADYNAEVELKFEELIVREGKIYTCTVCNKSMMNKMNMRMHLEIHLTGISFDCSLCEKSFRKSSTRKQHMARHHSSRLLNKDIEENRY